MKKTILFILLFVLWGRGVYAGDFKLQSLNVHEKILEIKKWGMYSVSIRGSAGSSFELVDRMWGPESRVVANLYGRGRGNYLLEEGEYKIRLSWPSNGVAAKINVEKYRERHEGAFPLLKDGMKIKDRIGDKEQLSYWLYVDQKHQNVMIESQGRALSRMLIMKDGNWLEDDKIESEIYETVKGQPMRTSFLSAQLEPGFYRVILVGGPSLKWATGSEKKPLILRVGARRLIPNSIISGKISSFGYNRYLVKNAEYFLLKNAKRAPMRLEAASYSENPSFYASSYRAQITKKSRLPRCEISTYQNNEKWQVIIRGKPGETFTLQNMSDSKNRYYFRPDKTAFYRLQSFSSGNPEDSIDASGLLVNENTGRVIASSAISLSGRTSWKRRFNLSGAVSLFLEVREAGVYEVRSSGTPAQFRIRRFFISTPSKYVIPPFKTGTQSYRLNKGFYIFEAQSSRKGIVTFSIAKKGLFNLGSYPTRRPQVIFSDQKLFRRQYYSLYLSSQGPGVRHSFDRRPEPIKGSFSFYLNGGEKADFKISVGDKQLLVFQRFVKVPVVLKIDGKAIRKVPVLISKGVHRISVRNKGKKLSLFSFSLQDEAARKAAIPPDTKLLSRIPKFEKIDAGRKKYLNLGRSERKVFLLNVPEAGVYKIKTFGLLKMKGKLRSRLRPFLVGATANGEGRNILLQSYLKKGLYQLVIATSGLSRGHLAVLVEKDSVQDAGSLIPERLSKLTVGAGRAINYDMNIQRAGKYQISSIGLQRYFHLRLEDSDGWPLQKTAYERGFTRKFTPGLYRLMMLPESVESRRLTLLHEVLMSKKAGGKGPIDLTLNRSFENTWMEKNQGGKRIPDIYHVHIPVTLPLQITLSKSMIAKVYQIRTGKTQKDFGGVYPDQKFSREVPAGDYEIRVFSKRVDNRKKYKIKLSTTVLADGLSYRFYPEKTFDMSLEKDGWVELSSFGSVDVAAILYDGNGDIVARNDDAPNDWNFLISGLLKAGKYKLEIKKHFGSGMVRVSMRILKEKYGGKWPKTARLSLEGMKKNYRLGNADGLYFLKLKGSGEIGLRLSSGKKEIFKTQAANIRLYALFKGKINADVWSVDHTDENPKAELKKIALKFVSFEKLRKGLIFSPRNGVAAVKLDVPHAGNYLVDVRNKKGKLAFYEASMSVPRSVILKKHGGNEISLPSGPVVFVVESAESLNLRLKEKILKTGEKSLVKVRGLIYQRFRMKKNRHFLIGIAESAGALIDSGFTDKEGYSPDGVEKISPYFSVKSGSTLSVSVGRTYPVLALWNPRNEAIACTLRTVAYPDVRTEKFGENAEGRLKVYGIKAYTLKGRGRLRVLLDPGMAAFLEGSDGIRGVRHCEKAQRSFDMDYDGGRLIIAEFAGRSGNFKVVKAGMTPEKLSSVIFEGPLEGGEVFDSSVLTLKKPALLHLIGEARAEVTESDGMMKIMDAKHPELKMSRGVWRVKIFAARGFVKLWSSQNFDESEQRWGAGEKGKVSKLQAFAVLAPREKPQWLDFKVKRASVIVLSGRNPVAYTLKKGEVWLLSAEKDKIAAIALKPGHYRLGIRAFQNGQNGEPVKIHLIPVLKKIGKTKTLIDSESFVAYRIRSDKKQKFALGAISENISPDCVLLDSSGRVLSRGPALFPELRKGDYTLLYASQTTGSFKPVIIAASDLEKRVNDDKIKAFLKKYGFKK